MTHLRQTAAGLISIVSPELSIERYHKLRDMAAKYPATIAKIKGSFYNVLKAAKIHQRVAV